MDGSATEFSRETGAIRDFSTLSRPIYGAANAVEHP
jgi:hypothetical protein